MGTGLITPATAFDQNVSGGLAVLLRKMFENGIAGDIPIGDSIAVQSANPNLWSGCPLVIQNPGVAYGFMDDFMSLPVDDTTGAPTIYEMLGDTPDNLLNLVAVAGGVAELTTTTTSDDQIVCALDAEGVAVPFEITKDSGRRLWFGCRVKAAQHATCSHFIGLTESPAVDLLVDGGASMADKDYVCFRILSDAAAEWDFAHLKAAAAEVEHAAIAANADDFHTFGFRFDGAQTIKVYADDSMVATVDIDNVNFPSGEALTMAMSNKTHTTASATSQIDWWKCVQDR